MQSIKKIIKKSQLSLIKKTQQGFTLLEVMLAIVVISTLAVFSIGMFQQQAVNAQVDKTALQMQQWLEAAKAYYVDNNAWPDGTKYDGSAGTASCTEQIDVDPTAFLLEGKCGPLAKNNKVYIQSGISIENNAWNDAFKLLPPSQQANSNSSMFEVVSPIPASIKNAYYLAQRVAGHLPNATVDNSGQDQPIAAIAAVTIPGAASTNSSGNVLIQSMHDLTCPRAGPYCQTKDSTPKEVLAKPICPVGMDPEIHLSLQGFNPPDPGTPSSVIGDTYVVAQDTADGKSWQVALSVQGSDDSPAHEGQVVAILTCETASKNNNKTQGSDFVY